MNTNLLQSPATKSPELPTQASGSDTQAPQRSRRQRQKAAKAKAAQDSKHGDATEPPQESSGSTTTPVDKVERSLASLTIAEVKALRPEESLKKHAAQHPPKTVTAPKKNKKANALAKATTSAKANETAAPNKDEQVDPPAKATTAASKENEQANPPAKATTAAKTKKTKSKKTKKTKQNDKQPADAPVQPTSTMPKPGIEQPPDLQFQRLPPCGIRNCPVLAPHERRPYVFNEPDRPNWVKNIQGKGDAATNVEWDNMDRFFIVHSFVKK